MADEQEQHDLDFGHRRHHWHDPERAWNDRPYENRFDHDRDEIHGSRFLEDADQIRMSKLGDVRGPYNFGDQDSVPPESQMQFLPNLGSFVVPAENTWAAYAEAMRKGGDTLSFDPAQHYFDAVVAEKLGIAALTDPSKADFAKYEGLRTNIAVLRDAVMAMFDPIDATKVPKIIGMAETLGDALANDRWYRRPFTRPLDIDVANVEGVGAAQMYQHLLAVQSGGGPFKTIIQNFRHMLGLPDHDWSLPPLEQTPFSDENLSAPPPPACPPVPGVNGPAPESPQAANPLTNAEHMIALSEKICGAACQPRSLDTLNEPDRRQSVVEAHTILRWLRNLQIADKDLAEALDHGDAPEQMALADAFGQLAETYFAQLREAQQKNPAFGQDDRLINEANDAAGALALAVVDHTIDMLPEGHPALERLEVIRASLPERAAMLQDQSVRRLLDTMALGFERISGKQVDTLTPSQRLVEMSQRIQSNLRRFRSVDTLEPPAREESVELAHIILENLKKLLGGHGGIEKLANTGRPEVKLLAAQKIEEMIDNYKNLLLEMAVEKPEIMQDPRINAANDAASYFSHAVALMAAKEMPGSIAAAQQISAVEDQSLDHLHDHHLNRVLQSAEGSTKTEAANIGEEEHSTEDKIEAMEAAMVVLEHLLHHKKRRGKSYSSMRSGKGGKKQLLQRLALEADDYVLKQGRFNQDTQVRRPDVKQAKTEQRGARANGKPYTFGFKAKADNKEDKQNPKAPKTASKEEGKEQKPITISVKEIPKEPKSSFKGLDSKALAAIQKEGGTLRDISRQLQDLAAPMAMAPAEAVTPDDKTFALRNAEDRERQNKPTGPRV